MLGIHVCEYVEVVSGHPEKGRSCLASLIFFDFIEEKKSLYNEDGI